MTMNQLSPKILRQAVSEIVADCRARLAKGMVDLTDVGRGVQAYCEAVQRLPLEEARAHTPDLEAMMQEINKLSDELVAARNAVSKEIEALGHMKRANVAYKKSDGIGEIYTKDDPQS